jgi:lambda family phage holin
MPDNPNNWNHFLPPGVGGMLMAIVMSTLRIIYDKEETNFIRIVLESLICGGLTLSAGSAFVAMGYGSEWYLFCGGMIGFMGSQFIRAMAKKAIKRKVGD